MKKAVVGDVIQSRKGIFDDRILKFEIMAIFGRITAIKDDNGYIKWFSNDEIKRLYEYPVLIILDLSASFVYLFSGDWKHGIYWIAAAVLTLMVTL